MELFGYLTFVGDLQEIQTTNSKYGDGPFLVREVCVHSFVTSTINGQFVPFMRGTTLRLTGRNAEIFNIQQGAMVCLEYGTSASPFYDGDKSLLRANGNLTIGRIAEVTASDLESVNRIMQTYEQLKQK